MASRRVIHGRVVGVEDVLRRLGKLRKGVSTITRKAITEATKPVVEAVKSRVPVESGLLRKSIGRKVKSYRRNGVVLGIVGPRTKKGRMVKLKRGKGKAKRVLLQYRDPVKYAHLQEFGTTRSRAQPFLRPGWAASKTKAKAIIRATIEAGIRKAAKGK